MEVFYYYMMFNSLMEQGWARSTLAFKMHDPVSIH